MANIKNAVKLGVFTLAIMNVTAVVSLRGLPAEAVYGMSSAFYYLFAAIVFLIPTSLVAAELAAMFQDKQGGVFRCPKGERPNGSFTQWSVTPFGFGRNFAGFEKRLCAYSKKSLWCGRSSGRVVPPLAAGRSPTDDFLSS